MGDSVRCCRVYILHDESLGVISTSPTSNSYHFVAGKLQTSPGNIGTSAAPLLTGEQVRKEEEDGGIRKELARKDAI